MQAIKQTLGRKLSEVSRLSGQFTLRSGVVSDVYFDKYLFESDPVILRHIAEQMIPLLPEGTKVLAGLELGGIPIVTMISQLTGIPAAFIRKEAKPYGTAKYAEGAALHDVRVTIIEDVVSSGGAILDAVAKMRADGIEVSCAVCVIDRESGGREKLADQQIELRSLFRMSEI